MQYFKIMLLFAGVEMVQLRGILRKAYLESKESDRILSEEIEKFKIHPAQKIILLPDFRGKRNFVSKYPLIDPFAFAKVIWDENDAALKYVVVQPELNEEEKEILDKILNSLEYKVDKKLDELKNESVEYIKEMVRDVINEFGLSLKKGMFTRIMYYIYIHFIGLGKLEPLMHDPYIEDIGCDGINIPVYVTHKKYGNLKTNVVYDSEEELNRFIVKLAERCGRYVSYAEPLLDGTLPDGSRVNATLSSDITTRGPTYSIRKFRSIPYSVTDLIKLKTTSAEVMAYLWFIVEHKSNILIAGGTGSGKTTMLNAIVSFIPPEDKVISIEDTRELNLYHENWIPGVSRVGFGNITAEGTRYGEITMFDLLKESFRENPDYVIVGEVRGKEASVLFQGMASGHPSMGTIHGGSVDNIIRRIETPPISLHPGLVNSLDVVLLVAHASKYGKSARRLINSSEIVDVDDETGRANVTVSFEWNPVEDVHERKDSWLLNKIGVEYGISNEQINQELDNRKAYIEWMYKKGIFNFFEVSKYISYYYKNKEKALKKIGR